MHLALLCDLDRLRTEQAMLDRLCVALIGEGATITRIFPEGYVPPHDRQRARGLITTITYDPKIVPWMRGTQRRDLSNRLTGKPPDVVLASGRRCWGLSRWLADTLEKPIVYDIWSSDDAARVTTGRHDRRNQAFCAATEPLARMLQERISHELVAVVPVGVSVPERPTAVLQNGERAPCIAILGGSRDLRSYKATIEALDQVGQKYESLHFFLELRGPSDHDVWRLVNERGLLDRTSTFVGAGVHRPLLARSDVVLLPEASSEVRTPVLELMAAGVPVIAHEDPALDFLRPDTAILISEAVVEAWTAALEGLLSNPLRARELGLAGRAWVTRWHRSSRQAEVLFAMLNRVVTGGAYQFPMAE